MLKSALGDRIKEKTDHEKEDTGNEEVESGNETLSQHSDSIMEHGPKKRRPGTSLSHIGQDEDRLGSHLGTSCVCNDWLSHLKYFRNTQMIKNNIIPVSSPSSSRC